MKTVTISEERYQKLLYCEACIEKSFATAKKMSATIDAIFMLSNKLLSEFFPDKYEATIERTEREYMEANNDF